VSGWPWNRCPDARGMSVRISVESLSGCAWNGCPSQRGIRTEWEAVCGARAALPTWLAKLISIGVCRVSDEAEERTREGLTDVDARRVVDHQLVEAWAASLSDDVPLPVPGLNQGGE